MFDSLYELYAGAVGRYLHYMGVRKARKKAKAYFSTHPTS